MILIGDVSIHLEELTKSKETEFNKPNCDLVNTKIQHGTNMIQQLELGFVFYVCVELLKRAQRKPQR